jgi:hypothetical protein
MVARSRPGERRARTVQVLGRGRSLVLALLKLEAQAVIRDESPYEGERDYEGFWLRRAKELVEEWAPSLPSGRAGPAALHLVPSGKLSVA